MTVKITPSPLSSPKGEREGEGIFMIAYKELLPKSHFCCKSHLWVCGFVKVVWSKPTVSRSA